MFKSKDNAELAAGDLPQDSAELRRLLDLLPCFVGIHDSSNRVKWINHHGLALSDKDPSTILGKVCTDVMSCGKEGCEGCPVLQSFETGKPHSGRRQHTNGLFFETAAIPLLDEQENVTAILHYKHDVTKERNLHEQLQQAQKLESVGRLASGIAHDFNNLLTGIFGNVSLARINSRRPDQLEEALAEIERAAQGAADLAARLLAFSRKEGYSPRVLDLNRLLTGAHRIIGRVIGEDVEVVLTRDSAISSVHADPVQMEQILLNLAVNARDAMPDGGTLTISTTQERITASQSAPVRAGEYVVLAVTDTGRGMDETTRQRIFEPFFTTKEQGRGTGLGLSTVYAIVQEHQGFIQVESSPEQGTHFTIHFPAVVGEEVQEEPQKRLPLPRGSESIWVVEDEPMVRQLAVETLRKLGYQVQEAENGEEALALLRRSSDPPTLLLTDVVMPKVNGRDLADQLVRHHPSVKVLFTSGYAANLVGAKEIDGEHRGFLPKPYTQTQLAQRIRELLDR
ncbi:MAG: response regulator [Deltaproteobacteria bacterium]|nr:response regulator [Deltaproteobacteria bacterium]